MSAKPAAGQTDPLRDAENQVLVFVQDAEAVDRLAKRGLTQIPCNSDHAGAITLALSRSILSRPYICRLMAFKRLTLPST